MNITTSKQKQAREHNWYLYQLRAFGHLTQRIRIGSTTTQESKGLANDLDRAIEKLVDSLKKDRIYK